MMKKMFIVLAAVAVLAAPAWAKPILKLDSVYGGTYISAGFAVSSDGTYVAGYGRGLSTALTQNQPTYWQINPATETVVTSAAYTAKGQGNYGGIDGIGGTTFTSLNANSSTQLIGRAGVLGTSSILLDDAAASSNCQVGNVNSTRAFMNGATPDAWYVAENTKSNKAYLYMASAGTSPVKTVDPGTNLVWTSVASNGTAVGQDRAGVAGATRAVYSKLADAGVTAVPFFTNPLYTGGLKTSQSYNISTNGQYVSVYMQAVAVGTVTYRLQAGVFDMTTGVTTELQNLENDLINSQAIAVGVTDSGIVIGSSWNATDSERTVIWNPAVSLAPTKLVDLLPTAGYDVTGWTFNSKTLAIVDLPGGKYAVTGTAVYNGTTTGFYAIIPEPATLGFLALGGLALIRRRR